MGCDVFLGLLKAEGALSFGREYAAHPLVSASGLRWFAPMRCTREIFAAFGAVVELNAFWHLPGQRDILFRWLGKVELQRAYLVCLNCLRRQLCGNFPRVVQTATTQQVLNK